MRSLFRAYVCTSLETAVQPGKQCSDTMHMGASFPEYSYKCNYHNADGRVQRALLSHLTSTPSLLASSPIRSLVKNSLGHSLPTWAFK